MFAGEVPYDTKIFESSFLGELGKLLLTEEETQVMQATRSEHHASEALKFRKHM